MPRVRALMAGAENVVVESNSVLRFLHPDLFASVLDPGVADFKASALRYLDRADALVVREGGLAGAAWEGVSLRLVAGIPQFAVGPPEYVSAGFLGFAANFLHNKGK
jgi:hypothetical protein